MGVSRKDALDVSHKNMDQLVNSLDDYDDVFSWINETLAPLELSQLDQHITSLIASLDIACADTATELERTIDDVSRAVPRLTYDLHFMRDGAVSLQTELFKVHSRSKDAVPDATGFALDQLKLLDTMKRNMEAARDVLQEAESWSSLELEVTALLAEKNYTKAATRLSEASRSMVVFQNTPEYDPRRTLMVNLQNQLEASLSSALVAAINIRDLDACRKYFTIFSNIQRESEFRNYYYGSRKSDLVSLWREARITEGSSGHIDGQTLIEFLPKFYAAFLAFLNVERTSIPAIFPDPSLTLSTLITSVFSSLQPTFSQRLSTLLSEHGDRSLVELIAVFRTTEEFAVGAYKVVEKIKYSPSITDENSDSLQRSHSRRRSMRMSMSLRPSAPRSGSSSMSLSKAAGGLSEDFEWDQELFQPFIDFQVDYANLERKLLDEHLRDIISNDSVGTSNSDLAKLLRVRAVDIFAIAEECVPRCLAFTHGYGSVGMVQALDGFFKSFMDMWTADLTIASSSAGSTNLIDDVDWQEIQKSLSLLASARTVYDRMTIFEVKLRSNLAQIAAQFRLAMSDPVNFPITPSRGQAHLLEQSSLNSAELHDLLARVDSDSSQNRDIAQMAGHRLGSHAAQASQPEPLLSETRSAIFSFANACQRSMQATLLTPLKTEVASYHTLSLWTTPGDPKARRTAIVNDLQVPTFSMSCSDTARQFADRLLSLPGLFETYADASDEGLSFSLSTLPHLDSEMFKIVAEHLPQGADPLVSSHARRPSVVSHRHDSFDSGLVSSAWISSLGKSALAHLTSKILPQIVSLSPIGALQLNSDLHYISTIATSGIVDEYEPLESWKELTGLDDEAGVRRLAEGPVDAVLRHVARMRGWKT